MRLNLGRIQRAPKTQPEGALNDKREDSSLTPLERTNSGHCRYLDFDWDLTHER
jgi:hypothetical protein